MERSKRFVIHTASEGETEAVGRSLGTRLEGGALLALAGPLGAGKTVFVRGLCRGLGVEDAVVSPTFILYEAFEGRRPVVHVDLYRLEHESEIESLGVFDLLGGETVVVVEWANRSPALLDVADVVVEIADAGKDARRLTVTCTEALSGIVEGAAP